MTDKPPTGTMFGNKPPLGLKPQYIWVLERVREIQETLLRYHEKDKEYPSEWVLELIQHTRYLRGKKITINTHGSEYLENIQRRVSLKWKNWDTFIQYICKK